MSTTSNAGRQLFVGNLPFSVMWQDLKDLFREAGTIVRADVALTPAGKSRGFGTVLFSTIEEGNIAINRFNNYEWHGRKIEVREDRAVNAGQSFHGGSINGAETDGSPAVNVPFPGTTTDASNLNTRALYVGNLPYSVGWQDLKDLFRKAGNVVRSDIPTDHQNRSKGFGTVVMSSVEEARKAVSLYNGYELNGRRIEVREDRTHFEGGVGAGAPAPRGANPSRSEYQPQGGATFVGAPAAAVPAAGGAPAPLPPLPLEPPSLAASSLQYGSVQRADVVQDGQGRSRGYGQIVMSTPEEAAAAIEAVNGTDFQGRSIEVREDRYAGETGSQMGGTQVFVGNDLKDLFRPHGLNPVHADILSESGTGRSKGCGIVRFATRDEAERAVQVVNGFNLAGRNVVVRLDKFA
ncbi:hypothetical protein BC829DRAFT_445749 [Chytridium lagenaria]|nr:hypothetical protein BC829DRAFT_445749 [Chytridium lagenaria]